jgi:hypothetical protein
MSGRQRLPAGEPRKASQRHTRRGAPLQARVSRIWSPGDQVHWRERIGSLVVVSMTASMPRLRSPIGPTESVSRILPDNDPDNGGPRGDVRHYPASTVLERSPGGLAPTGKRRLFTARAESSRLSHGIGSIHHPQWIDCRHFPQRLSPCGWS